MNILERHFGPEKTTHSRAAPQFSPGESVHSYEDGLAGGTEPSTLGMKDVVKNLTDADESGVEGVAEADQQQVVLLQCGHVQSPNRREWWQGVPWQPVL